MEYIIAFNWGSLINSFFHHLNRKWCLSSYT